MPSEDSSNQSGSPSIRAQLSQLFVFRTQKIKGTGPDQQDAQKHTRRREQVRKAQRDHRDRTKQYVRSLEEEVLGLKKQLAATEQENISIKAEITMLRQVITQNRITLPRTPEESPDIIKVSLVNNPSVGQTLVVSPSATPPELQLQQDIPGSPPAGLAKNSEIGMNFVLALEHPCLQHTGQPADAHEYSGHALTVQAALLSHAPSLSLDSEYSWHAPMTVMDRLLQLSADLDLDGELTPIQVWSRLNQHPEFLSLNQYDLDSFRKNLMPYVKCYGYGAVVDEEFFNTSFSNYFNSRITSNNGI